MRRFLILLFCIAVIAAPVVIFFTGFESVANRIVEKHALPENTRNSVKHAYTAAALFSLFRDCGMSTRTAGSILVTLGILNERVETYTKSKKDSEGEMRKDMANNLIGMTAAAWRADRDGSMDLSELIAALVKARVIKLKEIPVAEPATGSQVDAAERWLRKNQNKMTTGTRRVLNKEFP